MDNEALAERVVILETYDKAKDREIKELKDKVENLTNNQNRQALTTQEILTKQEYTNKTLETIVAFMEDIKAQPKKEKDKFIYAIIGIVLSAIGVAIGAYLKK